MEKFEFEGRIITEKDNREKYLTTAAANSSLFILNSSFKKFLILHLKYSSIAPRQQIIRIRSSTRLHS